MAGSVFIKLTENFLRNLERFPEMGRLFSDRPVETVEASVASEALQKKYWASSTVEKFVNTCCLIT